MTASEAKLQRRTLSEVPWLRLVGDLLAWSVVLGMIGVVCSPSFVNVRSLGFHDWDQMEAHRYLVTKTIRVYHQFPFWNPYGCGGHTSWGGLESGTVIVSPWLLPYLFLQLGTAMRVELVGMALLSAVGTWLLAGRFTRSPGVRAFVCAVFVVNGRWALQAATGHTWHLAYAWTPWAFYFFELACSDDLPAARRGVSVALGGAVLALMVYMGGIYPLPQTAVLLSVYGALLSLKTRRVVPVAVAAGFALVAFGLSAPKLLPILEMLGRFPRLVTSFESIDLNAFLILLTSRDQGVYSHPANVPNWGWHEYGMFIGWGGVIGLALGAAFTRGSRATALRWTAVLALVLGFGAFHEYSPWTQLHRLPMFRSQHVPTRWEYPGVLLFGLLAAAVAERALQRVDRWRGIGELAALAVAGWVAFDIAHVAVVPMQSGFGVAPPAVPEENTTFHTEKVAPPQLRYAMDWAPPALPGEIANVGTIDCSTFPGLNSYVRDGLGVSGGLGAKGKGDAAYRGEAYVAGGKGSATVETWSPNAVTVRVSGATPGDLIVLNQNWDPGWTVNGVNAVNFHDTAAAVIDGRSQVFLFRYRPRWWWVSLLLFASTMVGIAAVFRARRWFAAIHAGMHRSDRNEVHGYRTPGAARTNP